MFRKIHRSQILKSRNFSLFPGLNKRNSIIPFQELETFPRIGKVCQVGFEDKSKEKNGWGNLTIIILSGPRLIPKITCLPT